MVARYVPEKWLNYISLDLNISNISIHGAFYKTIQVTVGQMLDKLYDDQGWKI